MVYKAVSHGRVLLSPLKRSPCLSLPTFLQTEGGQPPCAPCRLPLSAAAAPGPGPSTRGPGPRDGRCQPAAPLPGSGFTARGGGCRIFTVTTETPTPPDSERMGVPAAALVSRCLLGPSVTPRGRPPRGASRGSRVCGRAAAVPGGAWRTVAGGGGVTRPHAPVTGTRWVTSPRPRRPEPGKGPVGGGGSPGRSNLPRCPGRGSRETKQLLPLERTPGDGRTRLRIRRGKSSGGNAARNRRRGRGGWGANRHLPPAKPTECGPRASPSPRRGAPALARPRRPPGNAGEGKAGGGSRDPGWGRAKAASGASGSRRGGEGRDGRGVQANEERGRAGLPPMGCAAWRGGRALGPRVA